MKRYSIFVSILCFITFYTSTIAFPETKRLPEYTFDEKSSDFKISGSEYQTITNYPTSQNAAKNLAEQYSEAEITFYSNGSSFSPILVLQAEAEIIWTWSDGTTTLNTTNPTKNFGSPALRAIKLKVTPWSAVRRINIGYDAGDDGDPSIERVADQLVSKVENMHLVAPYLKEWCSSYNKISVLDFSNFVNLETIECFLSRTLASVNLANTPKLKRFCFEGNQLPVLDFSDSPLIEDIRAAYNKYTTIAYPNNTVNVWHLCVHHNPIADPLFFRDLSAFPNLSELYLDNNNLSGDLIIPKTHPSRRFYVRAHTNKFTSVDFRGALKNKTAEGKIILNNNEINSFNLRGCSQINILDLSYNKLVTDSIDLILKLLDEYGRTGGTLDLRYNNPPSFQGLKHVNSLKGKGWNVQTDQNIAIQSININSSHGSTISVDDGTLQLTAEVFPANATSKNTIWSVENISGKAKISSTGLLTALNDGTVRAIATAADGSGIKGELLITISNQFIPVYGILMHSNDQSSINTDDGTLQITPEILPTDATNPAVSWSVINLSGKAEISSSGLLKAKNNGNVIVVATSTDGTEIKGELLITISNQYIPLEQIVLHSEKNSIDTDDGTLLITPEILPVDATNKAVIWSVVNLTGKAAISQSGLLTAQKNGSVKVIATATDGSGIKAEKDITIENQLIPLEQIILQSDKNSIDTDDGTLLITPEFLPVDATNKAVFWSVVNLTGKAAISQSGLLTAQKNGIVKVIAKATDGSGTTAEKEITIENQLIPLEQIILQSDKNSIDTDDGTLLITPEILPVDATNKAVIWSVVNLTGKAVISQSGLLTAQKNGSVKVIATATDGSGIKAEKEITIENQLIPLEQIILQSDKNNIDTDDGTLLITPEILPVDATNKTVIWSVVNLTGIAEINPSGLLTAQKNGSVKVIATATDGSGIKAEKEITIENQHIEIVSVTLKTSGEAKISTNLGTLQILYAIEPSDATNKQIVWSVVDETGEASINSSGVLTARKNGIVRVTARSMENEKVFANLNVLIENQIIPVEKINIVSHLKNDTIFGLKNNFNLRVQVEPTEASNPGIDWKIKPITGNALIDNTGNLTTLEPGIIEVSAHVKDNPTINDSKQYIIVIPVNNRHKSSLKQGYYEIYPNPVKGKVQVKRNKIPVDEILVELKNMSGLTLVTKKLTANDSEIDISRFSNGIYLLTITEQQNSFTFKLIKE